MNLSCTLTRAALTLGLTMATAVGLAEEDAPKVESNRRANTVVLTETGVKNLRIETVDTEEKDFEEIVFALGRIEAIPNKVAAVSSRVPGRIMELRVIPGDQVQAGQDVARLESRLGGDPPPSIMLKAPLAGLVTKVEARLGDPIDPDKAVMEITDLSEVYAVARVPEHLAGKMKPGTIAHIKVAALPDEKFDGELLRFGTSADKQSGTIDAIFRLPNAGGSLRTDMRAEFSIVMSKREGVVSVPRSALQGDAANRFVYVEDFELPNAYVKTQVEVGQVNDRFVEITSGLLPGDNVVTRGAYSLAFAGGSSVSLKEALDAAHGHEHNADGSELTPEQKAARARAAAGAGSGQPDHDDSGPLWKIISGILFVLLLISLAVKRSPAISEPAKTSTETEGVR
jgi:multidrug efflux pump subunit AcrA (membrane-fusion protein)